MSFLLAIITIQTIDMEISIDIIFLILIIALSFICGMCVPDRVWRKWEDKFLSFLNNTQ